MRANMFNAQLTMMLYRSMNWLVGMNLNFPINTTECFMLTDFWTTLMNLHLYKHSVVQGRLFLYRIHTILDYVIVVLLFLYYLPNNTTMFIGHWVAFTLWQLFRWMHIIDSHTAIILSNANKRGMCGMDINTHHSSFCTANIFRKWRILQCKQAHCSLRLRLHEVNYKLPKNRNVWYSRHTGIYSFQLLLWHIKHEEQENTAFRDETL